MLRKLSEKSTDSIQITSRLTVDAQTVQSGTAEKAGLFIQSISYFVIAFVVGFTLNARLTGILFLAVIPSMAAVIYFGTTSMNRFSKHGSEHTSAAASVAEGAFKAVQVVQAFDAFTSITKEHEKSLSKAMNFGVMKALTGAIILGSVYFIA